MSIKNTRLDYEQIDNIFRNARSIFIIGIGGISMYSIAKFCLENSKIVFGYDSTRNNLSASLEKECHIKYCSTPDSVKSMDLVIYTNAINDSLFEYRESKRLGIPLISRANFLGYIMSKYENRIGIAGMHGKSTTTTMIGEIFDWGKKEPTIFCGAEMIRYNSPFLEGEHDYFICECCEYLDSFLSLCPSQCVITNIDFDHPDYFKSESQILSSFQKFIDKSENVFINGDNPLCSKLSHPNIIRCGFDKNCHYVSKIDENSLSDFEIFYKGECLAKITLPFLGKHFILDATLSFAIAHQNGIAPQVIAQALSKLGGTKRRMELIKKLDTGALLFEDYAHHPEEIKATLDSLKTRYEKILCIFQPHTFSRSYYLIDRFKYCFQSATRTIFTKTYSAREENIFGLSDIQLATICNAEYIESYKEIVALATADKYDAIVIMGAGDIWKIKEIFV